MGPRQFQVTSFVSEGVCFLQATLLRWSQSSWSSKVTQRRSTLETRLIPSSRRAAPLLHQRQEQVPSSQAATVHSLFRSSCREQLTSIAFHSQQQWLDTLHNSPWRRIHISRKTPSEPLSKRPSSQQLLDCSYRRFRTP